MGELVFKGVSKVFGHGAARRVTALANIDLTVKKGELMALLGPSGCGKTTLLRLASGLEKPTQGDILFNGQSIQNIPAPQRPFALVFQNYALYPHMTAEENLTYGLRVRKTGQKEIQKRLRETVELISMTREELLRKPAELSGGQRQRVALGKAIMRKPEVFLLDEPLSNLDQQLRIRLRSELRNIQRALKATMLLVTHDQMEAAAVADRVALINQGCIEQVGAPLELYKRPINIFAAEFMANPPMNLVRGSLVRRRNGFSFQETGDGAIRFEIKEVPCKLSHHNKKEVVLGIRPEFVDVVDCSDSKSCHGRAKVVRLEPCGPIAYLHMDTGSHRIGSLVDPGWETAVHEQVAVYLNLDKAMFFDPASGALIAHEN